MLRGCCKEAGEGRGVSALAQKEQFLLHTCPQMPPALQGSEIYFHLRTVPLYHSEHHTEESVFSVGVGYDFRHYPLNSGNNGENVIQEN
jgi:hypothetical protein